MNDKIQLKRGTLANWLKADPVLMDGEMALVATNPATPNVYDQYKVGGGSKKFSELPYQGLPCLQELGASTTSPLSQKAVSDKFIDLYNNKANKVVRFDNVEKQFETDNKDVKTANSHILEFYTDLALSENERLVITNIYCNIGSSASTYHINITKFNQSTNISEEVITPQYKLIDNGVTAISTIDGEHHIFILFVSNGDTSISVANIGQGIKRMPYATEYAFSLSENKTILSYIGTSANMLRVNAELEKKFDKSYIVQELGDAEDKVVSQKVVTEALGNSTLFLSERIYPSDVRKLGYANSAIKNLYIPKSLNSDERIVVTYLALSGNHYYIILRKYNVSDTTDTIFAPQQKIKDREVTELKNGNEIVAYLYFDSSSYIGAVQNTGEGTKRMPYCSDKCFNIYEQGIIRDYTFQKDVKEKINNISIKQITIWGDSITWGSAASSNDKCYAMVLKSLLVQNAVDANVINCGVGGETFQNILVRQGAFGFYLSEDITLPQDKSQITIQTVTNYVLDRKFKNTWYGDSSYFALLMQGENGMGSEAAEYKTVNPIYANGHKCKMSYNGNSQNATITLCLDEDVANDVIIKKGTPLYCHGNSFKSDISVFSIGTNDGWTIKSDDVFDAEKSAENYINMIDIAIEKAGTSKVVICSPYGGTALKTAGVEGLKVLESALAKHFGSRFFNWREYLVNYGLSEAGLPATEQDLKDINEGKCPSSLLSDGLHPNDKGHEIIGKKIYEIMRLNGFI